MTGDIINNIKSKEHEQKIIDIIEYINYLELKNETLAEKLQDYNKDEDIKQLQNEIMNVRKRAFWLRTEADMQILDSTFIEHSLQCKSRNYYYELHPTGIGNVVYFKCKSCGYEKCITDI